MFVSETAKAEAITFPSDVQNLVKIGNELRIIVFDNALVKTENQNLHLPKILCLCAALQPYALITVANHWPVPGCWALVSADSQSDERLCARCSHRQSCRHLDQHPTARPRRNSPATQHTVTTGCHAAACYHQCSQHGHDKTHQLHNTVTRLVKKILTKGHIAPTLVTPAEGECILQLHFCHDVLSLLTATALEWGDDSQNCPFSWGDLGPHLAHGSMGPPNPKTQTAISISSAVFEGLTVVTNRPAHKSKNIGNNRLHLMLAMQPNNKLSCGQTICPCGSWRIYVCARMDLQSSQLWWPGLGTRWETDGQTDRSRHRLMPPPLRRRHNNSNVVISQYQASYKQLENVCNRV